MLVRLLLAVAVLSILVLPNVSITSADGVPYNWYNPFRLPWTEGTFQSRDIGCGVMEPPNYSPYYPYLPTNICYSGHGAGTANQWNIDFGTMSLGTLIRAIGGGTISYDYDQVGLGQYATILHAGGWVSRYGHMCGGYPFQSGNIVHQGDWIGSSGNTGNTSGGGSPCGNNNSGAHLHLEVKLDGQSQNAQMSGFDINHLSSNQYGYHESNNTGPGYIVPTFYNSFFRAKYTALNGVIGSTLRPTAGYCGYQSRWVHDCNVYYWGNLTSQNFMGSGNNPNALLQGLYNVNLVWGAIWYTYTVGFAQSNWIAEWMGRPTGDEYGPCLGSYDYTCQYFEGGLIVKIWAYFPALYEDVWACRPQWVPQCQWIGSYAYGDQ